MEINSDSQADGSGYADQQFYDGLDGSLQDTDVDYHGGDGEQFSPLREQDRFLPIANVAKIMKRSVPKSGKIAKDAKECVQECVSEFISFITSEAAERCQTEKRKTINGEDILCAMNSLGFDNYVEPLKSFLVKFRDISKLESTLLDESSNSTVLATPANTMVASHASTPCSTVLLTPTILSASGLTSSALAGGRRQFTLVNGTTMSELTGAMVAAGTATTDATRLETGLTVGQLSHDIKFPSSAMATLGSGTTIILPISTQSSCLQPTRVQLAIVNGTATTVSTTDHIETVISSTNNGTV